MQIQQKSVFLHKFNCKLKKSVAMRRLQFIALSLDFAFCLKANFYFNLISGHQVPSPITNPHLSHSTRKRGRQLSYISKLRDKERDSVRDRERSVTFFKKFEIRHQTSHFVTCHPPIRALPSPLYHSLPLSLSVVSPSSLR